MSPGDRGWFGFEVVLGECGGSGGRRDELGAMLGSARARFSCEVRAGEDGFMGLVDGLAVGMAAVDLGVGRRVATDDVEALAGIEVMKSGGDSVSCGDVIFRLWAEDEGAMEMASRRLEDAVVITGDGFLPGSGGAVGLDGEAFGYSGEIIEEIGPAE